MIHYLIIVGLCALGIPLCITAWRVERWLRVVDDEREWNDRAVEELEQMARGLGRHCRRRGDDPVGFEAWRQTLVEIDREHCTRLSAPKRTGPPTAA